MISRNDPCWCNSGKKWKKCHWPEKPPQDLRDQYKSQYGIILRADEQIEGIRQACRLAASILEKVCAKAKEGVTTNELNEFVMELHKEAKATPAPLNYGNPPYPKAICTSLNEVVCHGIPDDTPLKTGDILNIDVTSILNSYYGDCSAMVAIGDISEDKKLVFNVSHESLHDAISVVKPGAMLSEIGTAIETCAAKYQCSVVNQFVGHGVGLGFHEPPQVPHHYNDMHIPLTAGMTFTIEPMINRGVKESVIDPYDGWTARTKDGKPSAQWEHTILVTSDGVEVLTKNTVYDAVTTLSND